MRIPTREELNALLKDINFDELNVLLYSDNINEIERWIEKNVRTTYQMIAAINSIKTKVGREFIIRRYGVYGFEDLLRVARFHPEMSVAITTLKKMKNSNCRLIRLTDY